MTISNQKLSDELCIGIVFNHGGSPVSVYGFKDFTDPCLLAGFSYAIKSFIDYLPSFLPDINFEKENTIFTNFLNLGFYLKQFRNKKDNKNYGFIFRPKNNELFFEDWINTILNKIITELENTVDVAKNLPNYLNQ